MNDRVWLIRQLDRLSDRLGDIRGDRMRTLMRARSVAYVPIANQPANR